MKKTEKLRRSSSAILRQSPTASQPSFLHREPISFSLCPVKHTPVQASDTFSPDDYLPRLPYVPYSPLSTSPSPPSPRPILLTPPSSPEQSFPFPRRLPSRFTVKHTTALSHARTLYRRQRRTHQSFDVTSRKAQPVPLLPPLQQQSTIYQKEHHPIPSSSSSSSSSSRSLNEHHPPSPEHSSSESSPPIIRSIIRNFTKPSKQLPSAHLISITSSPAESQHVSSILSLESVLPSSADVSPYPRHPSSQRHITPSTPNVPVWPPSPLPSRRPPSPVQSMTRVEVTAEVHRL